MNTPSTGRRRTVGLSAGTVGWCMALAVLVLAPVLRIGFVLRADMVFVPRQDLLPAWLGLGPGLPRSVPQDAVVAVVDLLVPGGLLQPLVLVAALSCAGGGAAWLLRRERWLLRCVAATAYVWTPFVAERLLLGNWALLVAYAVLPWAVGVARDIRARRRSWMTAIPLLAVAALTPTGGLLVAVVIVPIAVVRSRLRPRDRWALVLGAVLVNAPWWVSALLSPASATGTTEGSAVFALRSEGPWGPLVTARSAPAGSGTRWPSRGSRGTWLAPLGTALLLALAALGARSVVASIGRAAAGMLALSSAIGVTWCLLGGAGP